MKTVKFSLFFLWSVGFFLLLQNLILFLAFFKSVIVNKILNIKKMLTGQRDADLEILKNLKDRDLLNVCLADKYTNNLCKNEDFWRNRFIKEHGRESYREAMKYKSPEKTWRTFYLSIVYY